MTESRGLLLQVVLAAKDKATAPLRAIMRGGSETAAQLKKTRDALDDLKKQQRDVDGYRKTAIELNRNKKALEESSEKVSTFNKRLEDQRAKHANLKGNVTAAKTEYDRLSSALKTGTGNNAEFTREFELAKIRMLAAEQAVARSRSTLDRYKDTVQNASVKQKALTSQQTSLNEQMTGYASRLEKAGIPLTRLGIKSKSLTASMAEQNAVMEKQKAKLDALRGAQNALARSKQNAAALAGKGGSALAQGVGIGAPLGLAANSFATEEDATTRLRNSMMLANGSVAPEFKAINEQAKEFGSRLPGTTADFINMMNTLLSQGSKSKDVLGGLGESAAYLGVVLKRPYADAALFASKLQDATQATSEEMKGMIDQIQRANHLGVDENNLLQGMTKVAPAMDIIKKKGLAFSEEMMPLLVMMDQSGMAGEASGNALRKVLQASVDAKRRGKANDELSGTGIKLDLSNGKGEFGGMDKLFAELEKLKKLTSEQRGAVIKAMFGDDAETLQVVNTIMAKGAAGYAETLKRMEEQASLRDRVNELLNTLGNKAEAATGSWNGVMVEAGSQLAPLLKDILDFAAEAANGLLKWMQAHPGLTKAILYTVAAIAGLLAISGTLMVTFAAFMGPLAILRFGLSMLGIRLGTTGMLTRAFTSSWEWASKAVPAAWTYIKTVGGTVFSYLGGVLKWFGSAGWAALKLIIRGIGLVGKALLTNPIGLAVMAIAALAYVIYDNWEPISAFFSDLWDGIKDVFNSTIDWITNKFNEWFDKIKAGITWLKEAMGGDGQVSVTGAVDARPPLSSSAVNGRPVTVNMGAPAITVNAAPGMDAKAVGMEVQNQLLRMDRAALARARGTLRDSY